MGGLDRLRERLGLPRPERERGIWFFGPDRKAFEAAAPVIEGLIQRDTRLAVLLSGPEALAGWLDLRFPSARVVARPIDSALCVRLFLPRMKLRAAVFLAGSGLPGPRLLRGFLERGVSLIGLLAGDQGTVALPDGLLRRLESLISVEGQGGPAAPNAQSLSAAACVERLQAILARDLKIREGGGGKGLSGRLLDLTKREPWNRWLAWRMTRYRDLDELESVLGPARSILCLGNGPSSEYPQVAAVERDLLFRVNHSWLERGFLTQPEVVFTGAKQSLRAVRQAIFGLQSHGAEKRLVRERALNPLMPSSRFFYVGDVAPGLWDFDWGHLRPTNGACMLATAVALKPERLIIAGIDLFQHPEGSYPGDRQTANAYSPGHSRETELGFILQLLASYDGELVILSEVLEAEWRRFQKETAAKRPAP